jgi:hypothetical protein
MSNKKKDRSKKKPVDLNLFSKGWRDSPGSIDVKVSNKLKECSKIKDYKSITRIATNPQLPKLFVPIFSENKAHKVYNVSEFISPEAYFYWITGLFRANALILRSFNESRKAFNIALLNSDTEAAENSIRLIDELCFNWWSTENSLHLLKEIKHLDTKPSIEKIKSRFPKSGVSALLTTLSESSSTDVFNSLIQEQLEEYRSSGLSDVIAYGAILSSKFLPLSKDKGRDLNTNSLYYFCTESILDQYLLLQAIVADTYARGLPLDTLHHRTILDIAQTTQDEYLTNFLLPNNHQEPFLEDILEKYTNGEYLTVANEIKTDINTKRFGLIELYARARLNCNLDDNDNLYDELANAIGRILSLSKTSSEDISFIKKICAKFRNESWSKSLFFHFTKILECMNSQEEIELNRRQSMVLGCFNTPQGYEQHFKPQTTSLETSRKIPEGRLLKHNLSLCLAKKELKRKDFPIESDYLKTQSNIYISQGKALEAIDFAINEYLRNKNAFLHLPIKDLCRLTSEISRSSQDEFLSCLIILDIYGRELASQFDDQKSDIFEDFLISCNTHKPSMIFQSQTLNSKEIYFLRNICTPTLLDNIIYFSNNDEVIHERVSIIDLLIETLKHTQEAEVEALNIEKDKVVEGLFADKLRAKIETGKLYVDVQALESHRTHLYRSLFEKAKQIKGGVLLDTIEDRENVTTSNDVFQISKSDSDEIPLVIAANDKTELITKIYNQCVKDFALNDDYGLDKYLSAEIRHNVFVGQIRSCFEKANLITERSEQGYTTNTYWMTKYHYVSQNVTSNVDEVLKAFSNSIDNILLEINEKFKVSTRAEDDCIFNFATYYARVQKVSSIASSCDSFEAFFSELIEYMWDLSGEFAKSAQSIINDVLTKRVNTEIERLESSISAVKGDAAMVNLMDEIRAVRSSFSKEVELVINWFRFVGSNDSHSHERLGVVIEATVSAFESIYGRKDLEIQFIQARSNISLNYREARSLFISLFTAMENASAYRAAGTPISIEHSCIGSQDIIEITNVIDARHQPKCAETFISSQKARWLNKELRLSRAEGGSGLYKMSNMLSNSSDGFCFEIKINKNYFTAIVGLEHEYFINRR